MNPRQSTLDRRSFQTCAARRGFFSFLILGFSLIFPSQTIFAQDEPLPADDVVRIRSDLVTIPVVVTDSRGRRVGGLERQNFELLDDGRPVETSYFTSGAERVAMLFLLDASGSTRDILTQQRETVLALVSRFGPRSRVAAMSFSERAELILPFTTDARQARDAFRPRAVPNSLTAIFDAALDSVRAFSANAPDLTERRIVILISDGLDTASRAGAANVINEANASGVTFYVIQLPLYTVQDGRLVARRAAKGFRELAEKTGGQFFVVGDAESSLNPRAEYDLRPIFSVISDDLLGQYVLGYYAGETPRDARFRRVEARLKPKDKRRLRLRQLREGYALKP
jgi:Ca-activated chloride channel family protein